MKLVFLPLIKKQQESTRKSQELQPKLQALQEKYKDDQEKMTQEYQKFMQENKFNPFGGCLLTIFHILPLAAIEMLISCQPKEY